MKTESLDQYLKRGGEIRVVPRTYETPLFNRNNIKRANFKSKEEYLKFIEKIQRKTK
jgi:hypothetical protein